MKIAFNKYLYLGVVLLLNAFANIQANDLTSHIEENTIAYTYEAFQNSSDKATYHNTTNTLYNPSQKDKKHRLVFDSAESDEVKNEESPSSKQSQDTHHQNTAFINAQVFKSFSKELQKNIQRYRSIVLKPTTRLHLRFQVFII